MPFKIDENLPVEIVDVLQKQGYDSISVSEEHLSGSSDNVIASICQSEARTLVTLDVDFADIRAYPPNEYPGLIVLRLKQQDKPYVLNVVSRLLPLLTQESPEWHLWIVEEERVRIRT